MNSLWNPLNLPLSEAAFRGLLAREQGVSGGDHQRTIELLCWIARAEALQGRFSEARSTLEKAEKFLEEKGAASLASLKIRWLLESGRLYVLERTPAQGRSFLATAWTLANESHEDSLAVEIAQVMAASEPQKSQQEWIVRAISIAENSSAGDTKKWLGSLYATLGWKLYDLRQFEKSIETFEKALRNFMAYGTKRESFVARWSIGKVLRAFGKTEEALAIQQVLLTELNIEGLRDGRLYEELAECLQNLKRTDEAQPYFELAYKELSSDKWIIDNKPLKLKRMKDLGKVRTARTSDTF
ncbi:tetratricopeptide repeat protein [Bdellovibrionota bacterium FG-2]